MRSLLFTPADDERKLMRALASGADGVVADLEDAVAPAARDAARATLARIYGSGGSRTALLVRINELGTRDAARDVELVRGLGLDAVVIPKTTAASLGALPADLPPAIPIIETAQGVLDCADVARFAGVHALMFGAIDLAAEINFPVAKGPVGTLARNGV